MKILVIDDESVVREMIAKMLSRTGYDVYEASDGKQGLSIVHSYEDIRLVITDLIMPEKEGIETILELKKDFPAIRILAISGGGRGDAKSYLNIAKNLGADLTLSKPFIRSELLKAIESLLPGEEQE